MKRLFILSALPILFIGMSSDYGKIRQDSKWQVLELNKLVSQLISEQRYWITFLNNESLMGGLYLLPKGTPDNQEPHNWDEVYFIIRGRAEIEVEGIKYPVKEKSIVYVQAKAKHKFMNISEDMLSYVIFSKSNPDLDGKKSAVFTYEDLNGKSQEDSNSWNSFLDVSTMQFGLQNLPQQSGGTELTSRKGSQIMYVVRGNGKLSLGSEEVEITPGKIVYIRAGVPYKLHSLTEDVENLVLIGK